MNLLLAEDDEISRLFLMEVLSDAGHVVEAVADGDAAVLAARQQLFDLLLLDYNLPGCAGDAALRLIRSDSQGINRDTPAIGSTADASGATRSRLLEAGFLSVLVKPMSADHVLAVILGIAPMAASVDPTSAAAASAWDDTQALLTAGGDARIVDALRGLMLRDLPGQSNGILKAAREGQFDSAVAELHKLRAACGFCGAPRLGLLANLLEQALESAMVPSETLLSEFEHACIELQEIDTRSGASPA